MIAGKPLMENRIRLRKEKVERCKMKKIIAIAMSLMLTFIFSACVGSPSDSASQGSSAMSSGEDASADATVYNFSVSHQDPSTSPIQVALEKWGNAITEASNGRITFTYYPGETLAAAADQVEAVTNGTADIIWSSANQNAGRFPQYEAISLPMLNFPNINLASRVCWELYARNDRFREDFKNYKVISLNTGLPNTICVAKSTPVNPADFRGLQLRVSGALISSFATAIDISPVSMKMPEVYEAVEKGVVDGMIVPFDVLKTYKFYDIIESIADYPISYGPLFVLMNQSAYNRLPDDLKAIFDAYCGLYCSELMVAEYTAIYDEAMRLTKDAGVNITVPSEDLISDWTERASGIEQEWISAMDANGYDGQWLIDTISQLTDEFYDEYTAN
jgi:TRAP-type C4-dicarboxylate transport system substrate-binding protein